MTLLSVNSVVELLGAKSSSGIIEFSQIHIKKIVSPLKITDKNLLNFTTAPSNFPAEVTLTLLYTIYITAMFITSLMKKYFTKPSFFQTDIISTIQFIPLRIEVPAIGVAAAATQVQAVQVWRPQVHLWACPVAHICP